VPWVLDEHNVESRYQREYFAAEGRAGFRARREVALLEAWERRAWAGATALTCVSDADASAIAPHRASAPCVIPNGVQLADVPLVLPSERAGAEVLFVGLLSHAPNVQAALFLAREVMPALWREEPSARLVLCGRSPAREVLALAGPRVEVTGTVPSVAPYLSRAAVYANALFRGAGSSLKVPEALASGLPLVSTGVGVRGFELREGEHYARAEDAEGFARALLAALRGRAGLDARALRARAVAEQFDWERLGGRFADVVFRAAEAR
jgi:glycosyltransferase involved in cell wall biosynthesis